MNRNPIRLKSLPIAASRCRMIFPKSSSSTSYPSPGVCPHDGAVLQQIGEAVLEQLDIIPAQIRVLRHIRKKYACPRCDQTIKTATMPNQPIPKSRISPGLLAYVVVNKFADALPLYRQEQIFARIGIELSRANLAH